MAGRWRLNLEDSKGSHSGSANLFFFDGILYHPGFLPPLMLILSISFQTVWRCGGKREYKRKTLKEKKRKKNPLIHDLGWLTCVLFEKVLQEKLGHKPKAQLKLLIKKKKKKRV